MSVGLCNPTRSLNFNQPLTQKRRPCTRETSCSHRNVRLEYVWAIKSRNLFLRSACSMSFQNRSQRVQAIKYLYVNDSLFRQANSCGGCPSYNLSLLQPEIAGMISFLLNSLKTEARCYSDYKPWYCASCCGIWPLKRLWESCGKFSHLPELVVNLSSYTASFCANKQALQKKHSTSYQGWIFFTTCFSAVSLKMPVCMQFLSSLALLIIQFFSLPAAVGRIISVRNSKNKQAGL